MARFTDRLRTTTGVRDGDPVAPVFDAIDALHARVKAAEQGFGRAAAGEAQARQDLTRKAILIGFVLAVIATGLALLATATMIRDIERQSADQVRRLDDERARSFDARVEKRAAEIAFNTVTGANARATAAEAQLALASDRLGALARNADDEVRDLVRLGAGARREDVALLRKLLRHPDANVRKACDALTTVSPATVGRLLEYFTANKGHL